MPTVIDKSTVNELLCLLLAALVQIGLMGGRAGEVADEALRKAEEMTR